MPLASQCQISTYAPSRAEQPPFRFWTLIVRVSGMPARATPVDGSVRMSERKSFSSTQYGPSVTVGVLWTQARVSAASTVSFQAGTNQAAPPAPRSARRVVRREGSFIGIFLFYGRELRRVG